MYAGESGGGHVVETPKLDSCVYVQGTYVVEGEMGSAPGGDTNVLGMCLRIFNFSRWGCSTLWDRGGGAVRENWHESGQDSYLEVGDNMEEVDFDSLGGNGTFCYLVGRLHHWKTRVS